MALNRALRASLSPPLWCQICTEHKTPRARVGSCSGKERNGPRIPPGHSAGTVLEAGPLHLVCHVRRQVTTAFPGAVLQPVVSQHRPTALPAVQPGKGSGFMSHLPLGLTHTSTTMVILSNSGPSLDLEPTPSLLSGELQSYAIVK